MAKPLAERLRPRTLDEYIGQQHLVGKNAVLRNMLESGRVSSFILWGPPGVGKTTMALSFARALDLEYGRIQFTPDVLPSDVTGYSVPDGTGNMVYRPGGIL